MASEEQAVVEEQTVSEEDFYQATGTIDTILRNLHIPEISILPEEKQKKVIDLFHEGRFYHSKKWIPQINNILLREFYTREKRVEVLTKLQNLNQWKWEKQMMSSLEVLSKFRDQPIPEVLDLYFLRERSHNLSYGTIRGYDFLFKELYFIYRRLKKGDGFVGDTTSLEDRKAIALYSKRRELIRQHPDMKIDDFFKIWVSDTEVDKYVLFDYLSPLDDDTAKIKENIRDEFLKGHKPYSRPDRSFTKPELVELVFG